MIFALSNVHVHDVVTKKQFTISLKTNLLVKMGLFQLNIEQLLFSSMNKILKQL